MHFGRQPTGQRDECQQCIRFVAMAEEARRSHDAVADPPGQAPQVVQHGDLPFCARRYAHALAKPASAISSAPMNVALAIGAVASTAARPRCGDADEEGHRRRELQARAGELRQPALLAQAQPAQRRAFQREHARGRLRRQRQRHRQRGEAHRKQGVRLRQHVVTLAATQPPRQPRVQRAQPQRAERQRHGADASASTRPAARTRPAACRTPGSHR